MNESAYIKDISPIVHHLYNSEESIGGLPIHMEGFQLSDAEHRSSNPLCLAFNAAQLAAPENADEFICSRAVSNTTSRVRSAPNASR